MASKGDVTVSIGVDSTGLKSGLADVEPGFKRLSTAAGEGGRGLGGLTSKLLEYRREETQQARSTRFFANELASLLPVSQGVAGAFGRMAGALAGGFGIGLAFEAVKFAAETWTEHQRKLEDTTKAAIENARQTVKSTDDIIAAYRKMRQELAGGIKIGPADEKLTSDLAEAAKIEKDARQKAAEPLGRLAQLQRDMAALASAKTSNPNGGIRIGAPDTLTPEEQRRRLASLRGEIEQLNKIDLSEYHSEMAKAATIRMTSGMERAATKGTEGYAKDAAAEEAGLKRLADFEVAQAQAKAKVAQGLAKFDADMRLELITLARADYSPSQRKVLANEIRNRYAAAKADALDQVSDSGIRDRSFSKFGMEPVPTPGVMPGDWTNDAPTRRKDFEQEKVVSDILGKAKQWDEELKKRQEYLKAFASGIEPLVSPIGGAFSDLFSDVLDGTASFTKTMDSMFRNMAQSAINQLSEMFTRWLAMKIAMGFVGAGVGSIGSASAASATSGGYGSMSLRNMDLGNYQFRAAGGPVSSGQTYIVGERGPEVLQMGAGAAGRIVPNSALGGSLTIQSANTCPSCQRTEMQAIAQETVRRDAPRAVANDMRNPNGRVSKGIVQNHQTARRR